MSPENLPITAVVVFVLLVVGLVLTALEFKYGAPKQQEEEAEKVGVPPRSEIMKPRDELLSGDVHPQKRELNQ